MLTKDLKRFGLFISGLLTTFFESLVNLVSNLGIRQILNPITILFAVCIATYIIHWIKRSSNNLLIKNNEDRVMEIGTDHIESKKLRNDIFKLRNENSIVVLLF